MPKLSNVKIGQAFPPAPALKKYYYINAFFGGMLGIGIWLIPIFIALLTKNPIAALPLSLLIILVIAAVAYWIPLYYDTIFYKLTPTEMVWNRGVWFKSTGIVPYNRITNVDIRQGPIERALGIGTLSIQTAGYSAKGSAEIRITGLKNFEQVRNQIMGFVRGEKPIATASTHGQVTSNLADNSQNDVVQTQILEELKQIKGLLGKVLDK